MSLSGIDPEQALQKLTEGNRNFAGGYMYFPNRGIDRRKAVLKGQQPFAAVLSCSDSRVPPELVFGVGLGDLFVIRTAGNLAGEVALASLEYPVLILGVRLIVVLGHQDCGAVTAAVQGEPQPGHLDVLLKVIRPAVEEARSKGQADIIGSAIRLNVKRTVASLASSEPVLSKAVKENRLKIAGGLYQLESGLVEWL